MNDEIKSLLCSLAETLEAEDATLFLIRNAEPDAPLDLVAVGKKEELVDLALPHGEGIAGWVVTHGEPVISNDPESESHFFASVDLISGIETRSILAVPVAYKGTIIGVIEVINKSGDAGFLESDISEVTQTAEAILEHLPDNKMNPGNST